MHQSTKTYLENLESQIKPGTRGAPVRRAAYEKAWHFARKIENQLTLNQYIGLHRKNNLQYNRPRQTERWQNARIAKLHSQVWAAWEQAPIASKMAYLFEHQSISSGGGLYDEAINAHIPQTAWYTHAISAVKNDRMTQDGTIIIYAEDTEWEKYGKRSYPRVTNRRIEKITVDGKIVLIRHLNTGEKSEPAINALIPGRADRIKQAEYNRKYGQMEVYKVVAAKNDKLISIFDGETEYTIGQTVTDKALVRTDDFCAAGGIFVHRTPARAMDQNFPDESKAADLPRILLRGMAWGKRRENGKIATENFMALEIVSQN